MEHSRYHFERFLLVLPQLMLLCPKGNHSSDLLGIISFVCSNSVSFSRFWLFSGLNQAPRSKSPVMKTRDNTISPAYHHKVCENTLQHL